ncbi:MAG: hypothetical protein GC187_06470 [Alphaproteobacteria bacterium]|nr:hypothetical protein [Alphaproteobacteria bacterium]
MALVKVILESGATVEVECTSAQADDMVASFARFAFEKRVPEKRTILTPNQSIYVDFSKVAVVRREF